MSCSPPLQRERQTQGLGSDDCYRRGGGTPCYEIVARGALSRSSREKEPRAVCRSKSLECRAKATSFFYVADHGTLWSFPCVFVKARRFQIAETASQPSDSRQINPICFTLVCPAPCQGFYIMLSHLNWDWSVDREGYIPNFAGEQNRE